LGWSQPREGRSDEKKGGPWSPRGHRPSGLGPVGGGECRPLRDRVGARRPRADGRPLQTSPTADGCPWPGTPRRTEDQRPYPAGSPVLRLVTDGCPAGSTRQSAPRPRVADHDGPATPPPTTTRRPRWPWDSVRPDPSRITFTAWST